MQFRHYINKNPIKSVAVYSVAFLIFGVLSTWFVLEKTTFINKEIKSSRVLRLNQTDFPLINPILLCSTDGNPVDEDKKLESLVINFIDKRKSEGKLQDMSVYFVNYKMSNWVGVNENDKYDPASMLKVPTMIAYYKYAENNPNILSETTSFEGDDQNTGKYFQSKNNIKEGKSYRIEELINNMILNSDNTAGVLLGNYIAKNNLFNIYTDMRVPVPSTNSNVDYMSAKIYAYFFRILYNGSYLTRPYSEKSLDLLTKADFPAIRAGVPVETSVAQKFGERSMYDDKGSLINRELHDCGYVYKKDSPYLLCVMSRGRDFEVMRKNIEDLSRLVYEYMDKD